MKCVKAKSNRRQQVKYFSCAYSFFFLPLLSIGDLVWREIGEVSQILLLFSSNDNLCNLYVI